MGKFRLFSILLGVCLSSVLVLPARHPSHRYSGPVPAASQQISQVVGYNYPTPTNPLSITASATNTQPQTIITMTQPTQQVGASISVSGGPTRSTTAATGHISSNSLTVAATQQSPTQQVSTTSSGSSSTVVGQTLQTSAATQTDSRQLHAHHMAQIQTIDVACGKERMTVRVTFDQPFDGVIYAKGHYADPNCRFTTPKSGQKMYQFDMVVSQCGVSFIDSGLTTGGNAYVEGMIVVILEPGVQEAWDAARRIRCLWEGNIDQTVTFPLSINMLDSETLTFSGDTATASLEIQNGRGPRGANVQGLVRVGELLTAVVTVQGDADFDLLVRNCRATDGTKNNEITLSDNNGCATKPKLMGGWKKQKNTGNILAYAFLSAFKFPDVMDLFLECTVSLCKGACDECPEYLELHVPSGDHSLTAEATQKIDVKASVRVKRSPLSNYNETVADSQSESLRLRRVVHVVGPDDLPELAAVGPIVYGESCRNDCYSIIAIITAITITLLTLLICFTVYGVLRRRQRDHKF